MHVGEGSIANVKSKLATLLRVPLSTLCVVDVDDGSEVPDWTEPPAAVMSDAPGDSLRLHAH